MKFHVCFLLILLMFFKQSTSETRQSTSKSKFTINKCCRIGDKLNANGKCDPGLGSTLWAPKVFIRKSGQFITNGSLPLFMNVNEENRPECKNSELYSTSDLTLAGNGDLLVVQKAITIRPSDFCIDQDFGIICRNDLPTVLDNMEIIKLPKCCGPHQVYSFKNVDRPCLSLNNTDPLYDQKLLSFGVIDLTYKFPDCPTNEYAIAGNFIDTNYDPKTSGVRTESGKFFESHQYCLDHVLNDRYEGVSIFTCSEHYATPQPGSSQSVDDHRYTIYSFLLLISVLFLFATLAVGFLLLSNHHVLHWRCQTNYVICLLIGDLLLAITQIAGTSINGPACSVIAHLMHFFFLATFFWLNVMCVNIWWTFRDFRPTTLEKGQELVRLRFYELYAWGMPIIITTIAAILDNLPESPNESFLRPRFGEIKCWFNGDLEIFAYFYGPIGFLLCVNVLLFLSTARQLTCGLWKRDDVKSTTERAALGRVCMKLVIVMGVTWIVDVVSWAVGGPHYVWYATDIINALQGLFIFIVVGCQPQVWSALKRLWTSRSDHRMTGTTNGPQHSSSSHALPSIDGSASVTNNTTSSKVPVETMC